MNANIRAPAKARLLTMIRGAPRPEFEQALLRVVVSTLIVTYMMWYLSHEHPVTPHDSNVLGAVILFFGVAR